MRTVESLDLSQVAARFFTDTHLGTNRTANTTPTTRKKLKWELYSAAMKCCCKDVPTFFLGDLFDRYSNDEATLLQGLDVIQRCKAAMAGNHDVVADKAAFGSFQALQEVPQREELHDYLLYRAAYGDVRFGVDVVTAGEDNWAIYSVPHHTDQELFEKVLQEVVSQTEEHEKAILCLHCNYNLPWDTVDTALNLTEEAARDLLQHFEYILLGHDHHAKVELDGRLIILGNTHPTGFGDIGDKYRYALLHSGEIVRERIWAEDEQHATVDMQCLSAAILHEWIDESDAPQFIDLVGEVDAGGVVELNRTVNKLWGAGALAIRNRVKVVGAETIVDEVGQVVSLAEQVRTDLADKPDQLALWDELSREAV